MNLLLFLATGGGVVDVEAKAGCGFLPSLLFGCIAVGDLVGVSSPTPIRASYSSGTMSKGRTDLYKRRWMELEENSVSGGGLGIFGASNLKTFCWIRKHRKVEKELQSQLLAMIWISL